VAILDAPGPPDPVAEVLEELPGVATDLAEGGLDVVLLFVTEHARLLERFEELAAALQPAGGLWIAWPKRAANVPTDVDFAGVHQVGLDAGLVDNKSCAISEIWSGLRFVVRLADRPGGAAARRR
jgi:hypothetical protein